jgi:HPt (histidine-containing phosphotransfer) domain-containing protein
METLATTRTGVRENLDQEGPPRAAEARGQWRPPEDLACLGTAIMIDLLAAFKSDTGEQISQLNCLLSQANFAGVKSQAHTIKGAACQLGAGDLTSICAELEAAALSGSLSHLGACMRRLDLEYMQLCSDMDAYLSIARTS